MGVRKIRTDALLLECNKGERIQSAFVEELRTTVQQATSVSELMLMATLKIRELDSVTVREEVENAVRKIG